MRTPLITAVIALFMTLTPALAHMPTPDEPMDMPHMGWGMYGQGGPKGHQMMNWMGGGIHRGLMGVDLTAEQKDKLAVIARNHQRKMAELQQEVAGTQAKLKLMITDDNFNKSEVESLAKKVAKVHETMMIARSEHLRAVRDLLTPEQRIQFDSNVMSMEMPGKGGSRMGHGPGGCNMRGPRPW